MESGGRGKHGSNLGLRGGGGAPTFVSCNATKISPFHHLDPPLGGGGGGGRKERGKKRECQI